MSARFHSFRSVAGIAGIVGELFSPLLKRSPERVARDGYRALKEGRRVMVPGSANRVVTVLTPFVPRSVLFRAMDGYRKGRH